MLTIVNGVHLRVVVARVAEIVDVVGFAVGLMGTDATVMHPMMSAYLNQPYTVVG